jgi:hypothetical protein
MNRLVLPTTELQKWFKVAVIFLAPVFIIYFGFVVSNIQDGFDWKDFIPNKIVEGAVVAYILNEILAYLKRLVETK